MPVPYPRWLLAENEVKPGMRQFKKMCLQKAVNFVIIALSWLHLNRPHVAPKCMHLHATLTGRQWNIVKRLGRQMSELADVPAVGPDAMGRTAVKVEGLDSILEAMHAEVLSLVPESYAKKNSGGQLLKVGHNSSAGRVVGSMKVGNPVSAKVVEAQRLSIPKEPPEFRPEKVPPPHCIEKFFWTL